MSASIDRGQLDAREVVALRHHLRPEQHGARRLGEAPQQRGQRLGLGDGVAVEADQLEVGELARELALELLRPRAEPRQIGRLAHRARRRRRLGEAAVVAAQLRVAVQDERDVAVRAADRACRTRGSGAPARRRAGSAAGSPCRAARPPRAARRAAAPTADSRPRAAGRRRAPAAGRRRSGRRARGARAPPSSRAAASPSRRPRRRPRASRASRRPCGRRSGGRSPACTRSRAPRRRRSAPGPGTGANTAERAPTTIRASPLAIRARSSRRSASVSAEWRIATRSPKRARTRPTVCGASAISGTRTIAPRPRSSTAAHACRYTSVFPLPVAPCSRKFPPPPSTAATIRATAAICGGESSGGARVVDELLPVGRRPLLLAALRRLGRHQRERPGGRRAVVVGEPERQLDQRGRHLADHRVDRPHLDAGGCALVQRDDDPARPRAAERHAHDRADGHVVGHLVGERAGDRARGDERIDGRVRHQVAAAPARRRPACRLRGRRRGAA